MSAKVCIAGCGDVGMRIAHRLEKSGVATNTILAIVRSDSSFHSLKEKGFHSRAMDFDDLEKILSVDDIQKRGEAFKGITQLYYLVPPQKKGTTDNRSSTFLQFLKSTGFIQSSHQDTNKKIILISTTGVYGDCEGEVVTEEMPMNPTTERSKRRADMESQWQQFSVEFGMTLSILRVPGIYSFSRLPRKRLETKTPVVDPNECGYTNRIHADDLAMICQVVMNNQEQSDIYNVSDGTPGKLSQYLLDVADFLDITPPEIISLEEGYEKISTGMMSYLTESRKIDNTKILNQFNLQLSYPDYREGIKF